MLNRRHFLRTTAAALPCVVLGGACAHSARMRPETRALADAFDREVLAFMAPRQVPGGALAVVKDRRLVYARGYGWAHRDKEIPVQPESLFRIASISKPITAVAVLKLIEEGKLGLETKAFDVVSYTPVLAAGATPDERLRQITIRQLLQHTGGWDRDKSYDPMFRPRLIAEKVGVPTPASAEAVIRYMLGQPLDFDPDTRYAYSNFGYCVLGRILEKLSGESYAACVQRKVLGPAGIRGMRLGRTLDGRQAPGEVRYYMPDNAKTMSVFAEPATQVPWPYGGFNLEAMDAHGGWLASAVDLARFAAALDNPDDSPLLQRPTFDVMYAPPPAPVSRKEDGSLEERWYGCGWAARRSRSGRITSWHAGSLPGTATWLVRRADGVSWAILFNQRSGDKRLPDDAIDAALHRAANSIQQWPEHDLFA